MSEKSKSTAFLLCYFLGMFGAHRFYVGRWKTAVLMLLTGGGLLIWWLIDTVLIMGGQLTDADAAPLRTGPPDPDNTDAGFWVRLAAISVDLIILQLVLTVLSFLGSMALGLGSLATLNLEDPAAVEQFAATTSALMGVLFLVVVPLYFGLQMASGHQATVGKRVFGLHVCTNAGGRLGLLRGLWRAIGYAISAIPLGLGFLLGAFTKHKRTLHDYLAGTRVLYVTSDADVPTAAVPEQAAPRAAHPAMVRAANHTVDRRSADGGAKAIIALGVLLLAGAAALALL